MPLCGKRGLTTVYGYTSRKNTVNFHSWPSHLRRPHSSPEWVSLITCTATCLILGSIRDAAGLSSQPITMKKLESGISGLENVDLNVHEEYAARFLVVATGENSRGFIPEVSGLDSFGGEFIHSSKYEKGQKYRGKDVVVVGCGNSGMEIAYDLSNWGARTSIVARSPVHVLSTNIVYIGMRLLGFGVPCKIVDFIVVLLSKLKHGDISKYGLPRPSEGPFYIKQRVGRTPTIDVGTVEKIRRKEVQVFPSIRGIQGSRIEFASGEIKRFDAIIFATGYKSTVRHWLKGGQDLFDESGMPKLCFPNIWKGKNGLYCSGFARRGLFGISVDSQNIAKDIDLALKSQ
ncbi:FLAVIN-BINDING MONOOXYGENASE-LIKE PROTEIN [Salix koriyanagi]|uniref:indole-3-pyruvate monooxygenase n=1 Tax=Salix koriyanagi TaxID=2511006 RepID=A0A9Q0SM90_9ROSI|nr:FLAVIN-BINDING MONOOXYGENASE-LIKE PROTEIN [Salix koriyanagi]